MKRILIILTTIALMLLPAACSKSAEGSGTTAAGIESISNISTSIESSDSLEEVYGWTPVANQESYDDAVSIELGDAITIDGTGASVSGSVVNITEGGAYRVSGTLTDGMINVDITEKVVLVLDGVNISHQSGPAIYVTNAKKVTVVLADGTTNYLTDGSAYEDPDAKGTLFSNDTLHIEGTGALFVTGNYQHGIASDDNIVIDGGVITIASVTDAIHANNNITVSGGSVTITDANDGIESEGDLLISGGTLTLSTRDDGIAAADTVTIDGGRIDVLSAVEGIESKASVVINDGYITLSVSDDGFNAATAVTINGGYIYAISSRGDALDSNGSMNINGGLIVALGGDAPEGGSDTDQGVFIITGGTMIATGGSNSMPTADTSTQPSVLLGSVDVGSILRIQQDGAEILTFEVSKAYQSMVFTSPDLEVGQDYEVYTGGSVSGGTDFYGLITGASYSGGTSEGALSLSSMVTYAGGTASNMGGPGGGRTAPGGRP